MNMKQKSKSLVEIHVAVFLFGLAGLFGKFLSLSSFVIVFGRVLFATIALLIAIPYFKQSLKLQSRKAYAAFVMLGIILAIHWTTFFESVQVSSVAIGLITFSTFPVFVAFMEPYMFGERLRLVDAMLAFIALIGIIILVPSFELGNSITQGVLWGIASGFTFALLSLLNRKYVQSYSSMVIALYQDAFAAVALLPFVVWHWPSLTSRDILLLIVLGVFCTAIAHSLFIGGMQHVRARVASMIASLEPFYGIIFAALLLHEIPSLRTIIGGLIILGVAFYATLKESKS